MAKRRSATAQQKTDDGVDGCTVYTVTGEADVTGGSRDIASVSHGDEYEVAFSAAAAGSTHSTANDRVMADMTTSPPVNDATSSEDAPLVKKRRTKNFKWREDMAKKSARTGDIVTRIPPLAPQTFTHWDEFIRAWTEYMTATKTLYRRRSSSSSLSWNSKNRFKTLPVPDSFQYATMAYWCTHGCIQPSRSTGVRAHLHNRFTGCTARITADVVYEKTDTNDVRWFIRVRNQISQHNHRISDDIFNCYTNNSSVPDELLLGPMGAEDDTDDTHEPRQQELLQLQQEQLATLQNGSAVAAESNGNSAKEVLVDEQKITMARSELQPLLDEIARTPSRVIHKRLQDVSEFVMHLVTKWEEDRAKEDSHLHFIAQSAAAVAEQQLRLPLPSSRPLPNGSSTTAVPVHADENQDRSADYEVI